MHYKESQVTATSDKLEEYGKFIDEVKRGNLGDFINRCHRLLSFIALVIVGLLNTFEYHLSIVYLISECWL